MGGLGWSRNDFWSASIPEVYGAIIGDYNRMLEEAKPIWEASRMIAIQVYNSSFGVKRPIKNPRAYCKFAWENGLDNGRDTAENVKESVMSFREVVRKKWGLKYLGEK